MTIWIGTDWHLIEYDSKLKSEVLSPNTPIILAKYKEQVKCDDLFIYLGDLCYREFTNQKRINELIHDLPGYKVLVKGNHDTQDDEFYYKAGFDLVCEAAKFDNLLFTHIPVNLEDVPDVVNIHGHLHNKTFTSFDGQHLNPYGYCKGTFMELRTLVSAGKTQIIDKQEFMKNASNELILLTSIGYVMDLTELVINGPDGHPMDETACKVKLQKESELLNDIMFDFEDVKLVAADKDADEDDPYEQERKIAKISEAAESTEDKYQYNIDTISRAYGMHINGRFDKAAKYMDSIDEKVMWCKQSMIVSEENLATACSNINTNNAVQLVIGRSYEPTEDTELCKDILRARLNYNKQLIRFYQNMVKLNAKLVGQAKEQMTTQPETEDTENKKENTKQMEESAFTPIVNELNDIDSDLMVFAESVGINYHDDNELYHCYMDVLYETSEVLTEDVKDRVEKAAKKVAKEEANKLKSGAKSMIKKGINKATTGSWTGVRNFIVKIIGGILWLFKSIISFIAKFVEKAAELIMSIGKGIVKGVIAIKQLIVEDAKIVEKEVSTPEQLRSMVSSSAKMLTAAIKKAEQQQSKTLQQYNEYISKQAGEKPGKPEEFVNTAKPQENQDQNTSDNDNREKPEQKQENNQQQSESETKEEAQG